MMFCSLPPDTLRLYLPSETNPAPALGLNIASPLDQGDKEACKAALALLRHSPDPIVREYYEARILGSTEFREAQAKKARLGFLQGRWMKISFKPRAKYITIHHLHIYIPDNASLPLDHRATHVYVRAELSDVNEQHPYNLIEILERDDPARRLGVQISAFSSNGQIVTFWGTKAGEQAALYANSIVDWLDGVPLDEIAKRPRRYIHLKQQKFLLKEEEKRKAKLVQTLNEEHEHYTGMISQELQIGPPTMNRAIEGSMERGTNVTSGPVAVPIADNGEGTTEDGDVTQRLYEAEFETEQERAQREDKNSASVYSYDTFLTFYCSRSR